MDNLNTASHDSTDSILDMLEEEQLDVQTEFDEKKLLDSLDDDFNSDAVIDNKSQKDQILEQGAMTATAVLGVGEQMLKQFGHKEFAFNPEQAEGVANAAAPLFVKYGGELPPWLAQYKEEIMFTFAVGALGFSSHTQIKALKKMDKEKEVKQTQAETETATENPVSEAVA